MKKDQKTKKYSAYQHPSSTDKTRMVCVKDVIFKYHKLGTLCEGGQLACKLARETYFNFSNIASQQACMPLSLTYTPYLAGNATSFEQTNFIFSTDEDDGTGGGTRSMCLLMREFASEKEFLLVVVVKCTC